MESNEISPGASSLYSHFISAAREKCIPLNMTLELTQKCNLSCQHCYNFDRTSHQSAKAGSLSMPQIKQLLQDFRDLGGLFLNLTGGEVTLSPLLTPTLEITSQLGFHVKLKTNGTLLSEAILKTWTNLSVKDLDISLYGARAESHEYLTQNPGSFQRTVQGIERAVKAGLNTSVNIILHKKSFRELTEMLALVEGLGAHAQTSTELTGRYDSTNSSLQHRLNPKELRELFSGPQGDLFVGQQANTPGQYQCQCARTNCGVGQDGTVYPCIGAPIPSGNLHQESFKIIWETSSEFQKIRKLGAKDFKSCGPCSYQSHCQRSSGSMFTNTGNYTGCDPWVLEQAKLLKELSADLT